MMNKDIFARAYGMVLATIFAILITDLVYGIWPRFAHRAAFGDVHFAWGRVFYSGNLDNFLPCRGTQPEIPD